LPENVGASHESDCQSKFERTLLETATSAQGHLCARTDPASGAEVLYLPPYSPDLNPIEKAWAKLKQLLRSAKARTQEALDHALAEALRLITADNARAWFRHSIDGIQ